MIKILITTLILTSSIFAEDIYATFNVQADKESKLTLSSSGIVKKILVDVGDYVKKDQLLLELDNEDLKTSILLEKKKIELATLNLKYAKKAYERFEQIKDVIDEEQFDNYISKYERSQIELAEAKANLAYKTAILEKTYLRAPYDGVISSKEIELGAGVSSAKMETLFTLITPKKQLLKISVDEKYLNKIKIGQTFKYTLDNSDAKKEAKISKIYPSINPQKRSITLEATASDLKVGMFGHGYLKVD
ncbi:efflux RND transporter periplasmic adaptor subunit [Sulfurimonas lithotrophica]|uniref:Efflux RND transporter periplasmic adaptor subunit n=1 Tax=Sulfurimonas lithotrophica TaxID=2590022 RepID=A0A5P8P1X8_9BACT|nr:efflux RND transporter periplasmic adaptor subunit [Sulfurimonas lithotrophica]QFR49580.1 efflux RND transporter periplasmic adaptor subunit [Sulfurimonas lithotrophica]